MYTRATARIVPHSLGFRNVGIIFGEPDNGIDLVWSARNGITMTSYLVTQFDKGDFVIVPAHTEPGKPQDFRLVLMNQSIRDHVVGDSELKYRDLERPLQWKNNQRPGARFLYFHFVCTILRYQKYEEAEWVEALLNKPTETIWTTPGPYLKRSVVKKLGEY